jgi:hypothetical protein
MIEKILVSDVVIKICYRCYKITTIRIAVVGSGWW